MQIDAIEVIKKIIHSQRKMGVVQIPVPGDVRFGSTNIAKQFNKGHLCPLQINTPRLASEFKKEIQIFRDRCPFLFALIYGMPCHFSWLIVNFTVQPKISL